MTDMEVGHIVDFIEEYNRMHDIGNSDASVREKDTIRDATQSDWDDFLG